MSDTPALEWSKGDIAAGILGWGFVVTLLLSEAVLTLPETSATPAEVVDFYSAHRTAVVIVQLVGFVAALLLALFVRRLRSLGPSVLAAGFAVAVAALTPGLVTIALAVIAEPQHTTQADAVNEWLPRADDLLFLAIFAFAVTVAVRLRRTTWLAVIAVLAAGLTATRLALEVAGDAGAFASAAPIAFLVLVATLATVAWRRPLTR